MNLSIIKKKLNFYYIVLLIYFCLTESKMNGYYEEKPNEIPNEIQYLTKIPIPNEIQYLTNLQIPNKIQYLTNLQIPNKIQYFTKIPIPNEIQYLTKIPIPNEIQYLTNLQILDLNIINDNDNVNDVDDDDIEDYKFSELSESKSENVHIADFLKMLRASPVSDKVKCEMLGKLSAIRNKSYMPTYKLTHLSLNYPHSESKSDDDVPE